MKLTRIYLLLMGMVLLLSACNSNSASELTNASVDGPKKDSVAVTEPPVEKAKVANDAAAILAKKQVPVLCYHHIRETNPGQSENYRTYSVSPKAFAEQMKALKDSGYETILPDQLYNYLVYNDALPAKPVMLTFDDTVEGQYTIALKEMEKYDFKGVFFIMTISINRPRYMTKEQIKDLADKGHAVESHTWDHQMVTKLKGDDFEKQFAGSNKTVEEITGKKVSYFAYPFGIWKSSVFPELNKAGYKMSFILSQKRDSVQPLQTVRRMIVPDQWSTKGIMSAMKKTFQ